MADDVIHMRISGDVPIRSTVQPYADRIELRFGRAYPVTLTIDRAALGSLAELIESGRRELDGEAEQPGSEVTP